MSLRHGWEVTWVTDVPVNEWGDAEPDAGTEHVACFARREEAISMAKEVLPMDYWGCAHVRPFWVEDFDPQDGGPVMDDYKTGEVCWEAGEDYES